MDGYQAPVLDPADTHRDAMAFWMYSSGSTGRPKGVVHLQHDALYTHLAYNRGVLGLTERDVVFSPPKIFFAYGFGNSLTFPFAVGATTVLMAGRPEPEPVLATIERHRPTVLFGLPTLYVALAAHPGSESRDLSSLRLCVSAAETLAPELFATWRKRHGLAIVEGLGSTEVLHIYLSNEPGWQKPGSSGRRVPGYELRLVDGDGRDVADGGNPAYSGCAVTRRRRATGTVPTRRPKRCAAGGSARATAFAATRMAFTSSKAGATTS